MNYLKLKILLLSLISSFFYLKPDQYEDIIHEFYSGHVVIDGVDQNTPMDLNQVFFVNSSLYKYLKSFNKEWEITKFDFWAPPIKLRGQQDAIRNLIILFKIIPELTTDTDKINSERAKINEAFCKYDLTYLQKLTDENNQNDFYNFYGKFVNSNAVAQGAVSPVLECNNAPNKYCPDSIGWKGCPSNYQKFKSVLDSSGYLKKIEDIPQPPQPTEAPTQTTPIESTSLQTTEQKTVEIDKSTIQEPKPTVGQSSQPQLKDAQTNTQLETTEQKKSEVTTPISEVSEPIIDKSVTQPQPIDNVPSTAIAQPVEQKKSDVATPTSKVPEPIIDKSSAQTQPIANVPAAVIVQPPAQKKSEVVAPAKVTGQKPTNVATPAQPSSVKSTTKDLKTAPKTTIPQPIAKPAAKKIQTKKAQPDKQSQLNSQLTIATKKLKSINTKIAKEKNKNTKTALVKQKNAQLKLIAVLQAKVSKEKLAKVQADKKKAAPQKALAKPTTVVKKVITDKSKAATSKPIATPKPIDQITIDKSKVAADKAIAGQAKALADKTAAEKAAVDKLISDKEKADADKIAADKAKADADKAAEDKAAIDKAKADADKAEADAQKVAADQAKAEADKAKADAAKAAADQALADKQKAEQQKTAATAKPIVPQLTDAQLNDKINEIYKRPNQTIYGINQAIANLMQNTTNENRPKIANAFCKYDDAYLEKIINEKNYNDYINMYGKDFFKNLSNPWIQCYNGRNILGECPESNGQPCKPISEVLEIGPSGYLEYICKAPEGINCCPNPENPNKPSSRVLNVTANLFFGDYKPSTVAGIECDKDRPRCCLNFESCPTSIGWKGCPENLIKLKGIIPKDNKLITARQEIKNLFSGSSILCPKKIGSFAPNTFIDVLNVIYNKLIPNCDEPISDSRSFTQELCNYVKNDKPNDNFYFQPENITADPDKRELLDQYIDDCGGDFRPGCDPKILESSYYCDEDNDEE